MDTARDQRLPSGLLVRHGQHSFLLSSRCGRLPFASQLGRLGPLRHGADIGQTQLDLSLLRHESRTAACPSSSGAARQFGSGIKRGKLMAKEYPGILLCMAAVLRSTGGRELYKESLYLKRKQCYVTG